MAWYDEAVFYHIYPLGLLGAPKKNAYGTPEHRLRNLSPWIDHIKSIGCNAIYIGPLFESVGHGYETTDYRKLDSRLGDNQDLKNFVKECHEKGVKVIFDGVFNHTGRDFFAFQDLKKNREQSQYKDWYCNVNFWGNNEYNDGFSYENWGGYNLLVKLNQRNPAVRDYICDVIRFWVSEFDVDGIRLDAADVLDFDFMKCLRGVANTVKPEFWLMGEVIHGDYSRWANEGTLHSVTNYHLHKAFYSGHNDHNYFEIAHTVRRLSDMIHNIKLYNFLDNHDVERIYTKLNNKQHMIPVQILLYTLPGIPSIYYGSEFGIEGKKERGSDDSLRPALDLNHFKDAITNNPYTNAIAKLGAAKKILKALTYGDYREHLLTTGQYAFSRNLNDEHVIVTVNNHDNDYSMTLPAENISSYIGLISGERVTASNGNLFVNIKGNSGEVWIPDTGVAITVTPPEFTKTALEAATEPETEPSASATTEAKLNTATEPTSNTATEPTSNTATELNADASTDTNVNTATEPNSNAATDTNVNTATESNTNAATDTNVNTATEANANAAAKADVNTATDATVNAAPDAEVETAPTCGCSCEPTPASPVIEINTEEIFEKGRIAGLQEAILAIMSKYGPITDQMRRDVENQTHIPSLINWVKSFR